MKSKTNLKSLLKNVIILLLLATLACGTFLILYKQENVYASTNFIQEEITDNQNYFTMRLTANPRKQTTVLKDERKIANAVGDEITYHCFKWSEIQNLTFRFYSNISQSPLTFNAVKFVVTNVQSDDLTTPIGTSDPKTLFQTPIIQNTYFQSDYFYYIDKNSTVKESATTSRGNDFGLYKFDFIYTYLENSKNQDVSIGAFYVAILPDKVEEIERNDASILYSPARETRELVTIYNLKLSNDLYKYVNPKCIRWSVQGEDQDNVKYILTQSLKDEKPGTYGSYIPIWQSLEDTNGTDFVFDSNGIEGTWTVQCTIYDSEGNEVKNLVLDGLKTIKKEKTSYLWLILLLIAVALIIVAIVGLILYRKRHDKVW